VSAKYHVAHILVAHKYEAEDLLKRLQKGEDFENLARKNSTCASASRGGDLGSLKPGQADEDFEEASLKIKIGEVSASPIRTKFGYHLIKRRA
jgi:peptidyl-prolyl cis-trans isomerase C